MLIVGDIHFSETSTLIVKGTREERSKRLKNMEQTLTWIADQRKEGEIVIQVGDFFDKKTLNGNELKALAEIQNKVNLSDWKLLMGNHGMDSEGHSTYAISNSLYTTLTIEETAKNVFFYLPYTKDTSKTIKEIVEEHRDIIGNRRVIFFSHNNIKTLVPIEDGYDISDILSNCDLFINGHIHSITVIDNKLFNVGNVTGQNFSENAIKDKKGIWRLDENTLEMTFIENPYALLYAHWDFTKEDITAEEVKYLKSSLPKDRTLVSVTTYADKWEMLKPFVEENSLYHRMVMKHRQVASKEAISTEEFSKLNHIEKFIQQATLLYGEMPVLKELV